MTKEEILREAKPQTREELTALLQESGWKLVHQERFIRPAVSFEIWERRGSPHQIRLAWPLDGDCNGATTTEIEIDRALHIMGYESGVPE